MHPGVTHMPAPSHWVPPTKHGLPAALGLLFGTPLSQRSSVHGFWSSTGTQAVPPVPLLPLVAVLGSLLQPTATTLTPTHAPHALPKSFFMGPRSLVAPLRVKKASNFLTDGDIPRNSHDHLALRDVSDELRRASITAQTSRSACQARELGRRKCPSGLSPS